MRGPNAVASVTSTIPLVSTFSPSDPKSQDISELTGSIDLAAIGEYGVESDPRAYRFDGELNVANRGLMEFVEMLKCDEKFLYSLLTLSQEQNIKTGRFALIYADEAILSHTNENEYAAFVANRKSEALQDRIIMIRVPYNLKVSQEERIYDKLLKQSDALRNIHIAPNALKIAAMFAVMTRLEEPKKAGLKTYYLPRGISTFAYPETWPMALTLEQSWQMDLEDISRFKPDGVWWFGSGTVRSAPSLAAQKGM